MFLSIHFQPLLISLSPYLALTAIFLQSTVEKIQDNARREITIFHSRNGDETKQQKTRFGIEPNNCISFINIGGEIKHLVWFYPRPSLANCKVLNFKKWSIKCQGRGNCPTVINGVVFWAWMVLWLGYSQTPSYQHYTEMSLAKWEASSLCSQETRLQIPLILPDQNSRIAPTGKEV